MHIYPLNKTGSQSMDQYTDGPLMSKSWRKESLRNKYCLRLDTPYLYNAIQFTTEK